MSADFSSSNPFRRKDPLHTPSHHIAYQQADPQTGHPDVEIVDVPKKITKRVRVQSPPPPSPSIPSMPGSASTVGEENYSIFAKPPTPPLPRDDDPFNSITSDISEDEAISRHSKAPANPFSKTLETMERSEREKAMIPPQSAPSPGRASMDVEAFKRLLMTGNAGLTVPASQPITQMHIIQTLGDGGSSTDTSSISRQSIFEAIQEPHPESPRTSHEISDLEDDRRRIGGESGFSAGRKAPPPPSSRHGKMIKVELRDEAPTTATSISQLPPPLTLGSPFVSTTRSSSYGDLNYSQTDLNKPLPPAPHRTSHDSERESVFDKESLGKTPEPPSPSSSVRKRTPPAPPLSRRHSQMVSESKLNRSGSGRLSPKAEEVISSVITAEHTRPRSDSGRLPPPPPSRRPGSIKNLSHGTLLSSSSTISLPPPPPARSSYTGFKRPPSVHSIDLPSSSVNKRASFLPPPPPPPHRHGRPSMETQSPSASQRTSGEQPRQSVDIVRRESTASIVLQETVAGRTVESEAAERHDILADLTKLQRDIDALRVQSEMDRVT
jgi:hypothetical protein